MRYLILFCFSVITFAGCDRDNDNKDTIAIVTDQQGCYPDSYLVQIVMNAPDSDNGTSFLCQSIASPFTPDNCDNAAFVHLPAQLAVPGKRIRFVYTGKEVSCLSRSYAPFHITVKSLRAD